MVLRLSLKTHGGRGGSLPVRQGTPRERAAERLRHIEEIPARHVFYSPADLGVMTGLSSRFWRKRMETGALPSRLFGTARRVSHSDWIAYLDKGPTVKQGRELGQ